MITETGAPALSAIARVRSITARWPDGRRRGAQRADATAFGGTGLVKGLITIRHNVHRGGVPNGGERRRRGLRGWSSNMELPGGASWRPHVFQETHNMAIDPAAIEAANRLFTLFEKGVKPTACRTPAPG